MATHATTSVRAGTRPRKINPTALAWFSLLVVAGGLAALAPIFILGLLGAAGAGGICWLAYRYMRRAGLEVWQVCVLVAISGYMLLNYGFENITIHVGGAPIIISYGLMYGALAMAIFSHHDLITKGLQEPTVLCLVGLLVVSGLHLIFNVPSYGLWAVRDSTMFLDGMFVLLGLAWAMKGNIGITTKWLMVLFVVIMLYEFTLPWGDSIWSWSPESGVFLKVPILGNFNGCGDMLLAGALFFICVGSLAVKRFAWLMPVLAVGQLLGVTVAQVRRMYVGAAVAIVLLILLGEIKKFTKLLVFLPVALTLVLAVTTFGGLEINGRMGPINLDFYKDHLRSIETSEGTPGSSVESRFSMVDEAMGHFRAHPIFGEGFGLPLLSELDMNLDQGAVSRVPHNSSMTCLARLGIIGLTLWVALHVCIWKKFYSAYQQRHTANKLVYSLVIWVFLFYVLLMITSFVEATFEFPSGSVPFYFFVGYGLGLIRWRLNDKEETDSRLPAFSPRVQRA